MNVEILRSAKALPLSERIELAEALWESITTEGYEPSLTQPRAEELDRRVEAHQQNPNDVVSWKNVKAELEAKYRKGK